MQAESLTMMDQEAGWNRMVSMMPLLSILPDISIDVFKAIYTIGWIDGDEHGHITAIKNMLDGLQGRLPNAN